MRLNDPLITTIEYKENEYEIDLSFDNVLDVFDIMQDEEFLPYERAEIGLALLIGENELEILDQLDLFEMIWEEYINIGEEEFVERDLNGNPMPAKKTDKIIDLQKDAKFIYASFRQIGINLFNEQGKMQWVEFQALLEALPDDCIMSKIIKIRTYEPSKGESADHKLEMMKLKKKYSLAEEGD